MSKCIDLTGKKFNKLKVLKRLENNKNNCAQWLCCCDCGNETVVISSSLNSGQIKSCGCLTLERIKEVNSKHNLHNHKLYQLWKGMRKRCNNQNAPDYHNYGGRGIKICKRWDEFKNFLDDMEERPSKKHTLDRIDNNGDYSPENCRWATAKEQANNRRNSIFIKYNNETFTMLEFSKKYNINYNTFREYYRNKKFSIKEILKKFHKD